MRHIKALTFVASCLLGLGAAQAEILDSEDFESFADVPFEIVDADDWVVAAGQEAVVNVVETSLSYKQGAVSVDGGNRALEIGPDMPGATTNNFVDWLFAEVAADDLSDVWFSYLIQTSETASTSIPDVDEDRDFFQLHFSAAGDQAQSVSVVLDNQTPVVDGLGGDHIFRARSGSSGNVTDPGQAFRNTPEQTHFIVGHIEAVNGEYETISIFANPGLPTAPSTPTAMATFGGMDATSLAQFTARISALEPEDSYLIDELKVGETYDDVASVDANFVLGDFDADGSLGFGDFLVLANNLFDGTSYDQGDFDFSGQVDLLDFVLFREAFAAANPAGAAAVPEPSGMLLLPLAVTGLLNLRRRRREQSRVPDRSSESASALPTGSVIMRSARNQALLGTTLVALICAPALGQATIYNWIATDDVADWNVDANWDSVFGNAVPNADAFEGENALINNGRTALADVRVPKVAGLEIRNGTVGIPSGGTVETIVDEVAAGGLNVGGAGVVNLSGDGTLIVAGDATSAGTLRLSGPNASMTVGGDFLTTGTLAAGITADDHGVISVDGAATLGGTLQVEVVGTTPTFGQSWDLLNASSISGRFGSVDAVGAAALPRGLQYQATTDGNMVSLQVGNALIASVDRQTGTGMIENAVGDSVEITSYALGSNNGLLDSNWQGVLGEGWTTANPTANHVAELNLSGSLQLDVNAKIEIGNTYAGGPASPADEDLVFQYTTVDGSLRTGIVEYTGALNDIVLHVDPADGSAAIANLSKFIEAPELTSYAVRSESGGLTVGTWTSLADSGVGGEGWTKANPTSQHIAELNLESSKLFSNGTLLPLGTILTTNAEQDLLFEYTTLAGNLFRGTVQYGPIPTLIDLPGDCNGDGQINAMDLACVGDIAERDIVLAALTTLPGDLNGDGSVAFADFLTLSTNFNDPAKTRYVDGNIDLENSVAFPDFLVLSTNFNKTPGAVAAAVPEPASLGWLLVASLAAFLSKRPRRTTWR